jgi:cytochrome c553
VVVFSAGVTIMGHCKMQSYEPIFHPFLIRAMKPFAALFLPFALSVFFLAPAAAKDAAPKPAEEKKVVKPDLAAGSAKYAAVCASCHNADGNSAVPANPKLAGQHPEYLIEQLQEYKSGKRANAIMSGMAATLSNDDMRNISFWLASQTPKAGSAKNKDWVAVGERIYKGGLADRQVPACAGCHSPSGAGIPSQYPRLSGQHAEYTAAQLTAFRDGVRKNNASMTQIAAKLNDREIKALSDYIAGLR